VWFEIVMMCGKSSSIDWKIGSVDRHSPLYEPS